MPVSDHDQAQVVQLLLRDVQATAGVTHEAVVRQHAANVASFVDDPARYRDKLVEDVQQHFHDCFVDTTWPACPRHLTHPLWLHGESWCCEQDDEAIARLGELAHAYQDDAEDSGHGQAGG